MREIKFRQYSGTRWHYWGLGIEGAIFKSPMTSSDDEDMPSSQYTGLKNKDGVEIYEGDIIQYKHYYAVRRWWGTTREIPEIEKEVEQQRQNYTVRKDVVKFDKGSFELAYNLSIEDAERGEKFRSGKANLSNFEEKYWDFEVIGNIYENPELLK